MQEAVQLVIDALSLGSLYALLALGIAVIFGIMRLINFAHGDLIMIAAYVLFFLDQTLWGIALVALMVVAVGVALAMDRVAFRPLRGADPSALLVASFGISILLQNGVVLTVGARPKGVRLPAFTSESFLLGDIRIAKINVVIIVTTVVLLVLLALFLKKTLLGTYMRAAAEDFEVSRLLGVRANLVIAAAFAISGFLAGVAAFLVLSQTGIVFPTMGVPVVLIAFVATIIGGLGSLLGAVLGGFLLGGLTVLLQILLPLGLQAYRDAFAFTGVIVVLLLRPEGLIVPKGARTRV